ncbi:MAG: hypothetical protein MUF81_18015, partial [Verrucomicrobia bacterium]|nr:hypothetical protein [Verrucomicrobiota bacterium]
MAVSAPAGQQVIFPPSAMPRVDMHPHMDAKTQYAKAVKDNLNSTCKLPADWITGLSAGTCEIKVAAKNSIGLVRTASTTNELTVVASPHGVTSEQAKEPDQAGDRLSPAAFADPPVHARPGGFWDWLNGSITLEQITRDLEAMKR